ncbi:MAG TPA: zf-HC2 domain-containing protein [Steroidobacteraceae bacterium]|nr:zf-HC2 domain-containing protein [Steroidobacteraceae bacterium]
MNHRNAWDLIPWFVNGSIADNERAGLQHHVEGCAACREEIEAQRLLLQTMRTPPQVESMPHGSLQKLWQRIDENPAPAQEEAPVARSPQAFRWLAAAVIVQALLLGVLATVMLRSPRSDADAAYRTVSTAVVEPGPASVRAVFSPDMTLGELQALLERAHLRIVNGPSADGVYTLATATRGDDPKQALLTLRAHPAARFAEPIGH